MSLGDHARAVVTGLTLAVVCSTLLAGPAWGDHRPVEASPSATAAAPAAPAGSCGNEVSSNPADDTSVGTDINADGTGWVLTGVQSWCPTGPRVPILAQSQWAVLCGAIDGVEAMGGSSWRCTAGAINIRQCVDADGAAQVLHALFRQSREAESDPWPGVWHEVAGTRRCGPPDGTDHPVLSRTAFDQLLVEAPKVYGPPYGWTLINLATPIYVAAAEQRMGTTLLGHAVEVKAVPVHFDWQFSDGTGAFPSTSPGRPWPDNEFVHEFRHEGEATITVDITWVGYYRLAGAAEWHLVDGTVTRRSVSDPFTVHTARAHLVDEPLP